jgi:hypothetical protein
MTKDAYYQLLTKKTAGQCRRCDSQLANFHRKTARILRVTETEKKLVHARHPQIEDETRGFPNAARVQKFPADLSALSGAEKRLI